MIRARLWFRCAAMHDPVTPCVVRPAVISWKAKERDVDLTIERSFSGEELVNRMKGWITVDPRKAVELVQRYGFLKVLDDEDLFVELENEEDFDRLEQDLREAFGDQADLERA
ncbi:MAG: hypothetical protein PVG49_18805 [Desulfobacteraceae bacterium]